MESRVLKLTDQLNALMDQRKDKTLKANKLNKNLAVATMEAQDSAATGLGMSQVSLGSFAAEDSYLGPEQTLGGQSSYQTLGGGGLTSSQMTMGGFEAQKARIQSTIELQLDKALEEERVGMTYKQVLRRMKEELTVLKKSAEDMRGAVDEFNNAMQSEKMRLRGAMQSRREALGLWQQVQDIREESKSLWMDKIRARERVVDTSGKEKEKLETEAYERDLAKKRSAFARRKSYEMSAVMRFSEGKVPFTSGPNAKQGAGMTEEQAAVRDLRNQHAEDEMLGRKSRGELSNQQASEVAQRQFEAMQDMEHLQAFMREVQVADVDELIAKLDGLQHKQEGAAASRDRLEDQVFRMQEELKALWRERDAEKLRVHGLGTGAKEGQEEVNSSLEQAQGRVQRERLALVRSEQSLSRVLMGVRLLTRRIEGILMPGAPPAKLDPALVSLSQRRLAVPPPELEEEDSEDHSDEVVAAVKESWDTLLGRVDMVLAREKDWAPAPGGEAPAAGGGEAELAAEGAAEEAAGEGAGAGAGPQAKAGADEGKDAPGDAPAESAGEEGAAEAARSRSRLPSAHSVKSVRSARGTGRRASVSIVAGARAMAHDKAKGGKPAKSKSKLGRSGRPAPDGNMRVRLSSGEFSDDSEDDDFGATLRGHPHHATRKHGKHADAVVDRRFLKERARIEMVKAARAGGRKAGEDGEEGGLRRSKSRVR